MKNYKLKKSSLLSLATVLMISTSACDSGISFNATRGDSSNIPSISANLTQTQAGSSVRIPNITLVPQALRDASDIRVAFDNSKTTYPVTKNSDGSLSFPLSTSVKIDSNGNFNAIFIVDNEKSYLTTLKTGPILKLGNPGIIVTPSTGSVIKGEKVKLAANIPSDAKNKYIFSWFYVSAAGQVPISGTSDSIEWTPPSIGNYVIGITMLDASTGATSSYTSPTPIVFVTDANNIISTSSSTVLRGKETTLTANLPSVDPTKFEFTWSAGVSPQGPFTTISGNTQSVSWTPTNSGSYYIKLDALNKDTQQTSTYTTTDPLVFVTENENIIATDPSSGNIVRGSSVKLTANTPVDAGDGAYSWSYASSLQSPFVAIPGSSKTVEWTPAQAGSYYVKADVVDKTTNKVSTFISPKAIVFVSEANNVFKTDVASVTRGNFVNITADVPGAADKQFQYNWSYSASGQPGTFQAMTNIKTSINSNTIRWRPSQKGSFYVKVDAVNLGNQSVVSFTSTSPIVFVNETTPLFTTDPASGKILQDSDITITANLASTTGSTLAWSYGPSQAGPWIAIGGTSINKIVWDQKARAQVVNPTTGLVTSPAQQSKPAGTFYVKLDITDYDSTDRLPSTFISDTPLIFIESQSQSSNFNNSSSFGQGK